MMYLELNIEPMLQPSACQGKVMMQILSAKARRLVQELFVISMYALVNHGGVFEVNNQRETCFWDVRK